MPDHVETLLDDGHVLLLNFVSRFAALVFWIPAILTLRAAGMTFRGYYSTVIGAVMPFRTRIMDCAARIEVFGFAGSGLFSILAVSVLYSLVTVISWLLPFAKGSAQISTWVFSAPIPAKDSVAATLTLAGKPFVASKALPLKRRVRVVMAVRSMFSASI